VSTEQRNKAATGYVEFIENFDECVKAEHDFKQGWDAHAATMPDKKTALQVINAIGVLYDAKSLQREKESTRLADAVLALLNKEGD